MDKAAFTQIRQCLGKTQRELAVLLGVSLKGIQSFEQGWRSIPTHVERQLYFLVIMKTSQTKMTQPCWEVKQCSDEMRQNCPAWEFQAKNFCWMTNGLICQGKIQKSWKEKIDICRNCSIFNSTVPHFAVREEGGEGG